MDRRTLPFVCAVATLAVGATACKGKVAQCNAFIDRANQSQTVVGTMRFDSEDPAALEADAAKIEAEAKAVEAVSLKDETLLGFKKAYGKNLGDLAKNVHDLAKLNADAKAGKGVEARAKSLAAEAEKVEQESAKLIDDINKYCSGSD